MTSRIASKAGLAHALALVAMLSGGLATAPAVAMPVFFDFSGACTRNCDAANGGQGLSGFIQTTDTAVASGTIRTEDIIDYSLRLGDISVSLDSALSYSAFINLDPTATTFGTGIFRIDLSPGVRFFAAEKIDRWLYSSGGERMVGTGSFLRRSAVPEPGTAMLLGLGVLALRLTRSRRLV